MKESRLVATTLWLVHGSPAKRPQLCQGCHDEARHPTPYGSAQEDDFFPVTAS